MQFIRDPNELIREPEAWLIWAPPNHPLARHFSLYTFEGGLPYLIKTTNTTAVTWSIRGRPVRRRIDWLPDSFNLVGFSLPATGSRTFDTFFAGASGLSNSGLYRLDSQGRWIATDSSASMQRGEAFWIRANNSPNFQGPIRIHTDRRIGLDFGRILTEQNLQIHNDSPVSRTVTVRLLSSESPPPGTDTALAGDVPLSYWQNNFTSNLAGWTDFPSLLQSNVPPGGTWELRLEIRRRSMAAYTPPLGVTNALYQSLLEISDSSGLFRQLVPVFAEGMQALSTGTGGAAGSERTRLSSAPPPAPHPHAGLWIGNASINLVSQPPSSIPVPTASDFSYRLIVHVDASGSARLLQNVIQMWAPGTTRLADDITGNLVVDQPGRFVLLTDVGRMPQFKGAGVRDDQPIARRYSSAVFGFREPVPMQSNGSFGADGSVLTVQVLLTYNDPLNPFVHSFHPDHNNLDDRQQPLRTNLVNNLVRTSESWSIRRDLVMEFSGADPERLDRNLAGWGDTQLGGSFSETITGLHKIGIVLRGTFRLHRASHIAVLNE